MVKDPRHHGGGPPRDLGDELSGMVFLGFSGSSWGHLGAILGVNLGSSWGLAPLPPSALAVSRARLHVTAPPQAVTV